MTTQSTSLRLADHLSANPYAFPGGYPMYAFTSDAAVLCHKCCKSERVLIGTTTGNDGWCVVALEINDENDHLYCDHCSSKIEAAYVG